MRSRDVLLIQLVEQQDCLDCFEDRQSMYQMLMQQASFISEQDQTIKDLNESLGKLRGETASSRLTQLQLREDSDESS